jgi:hypothetical protein
MTRWRVTLGSAAAIVASGLALLLGAWWGAHRFEVVRPAIALGLKPPAPRLSGILGRRPEHRPPALSRADREPGPDLTVPAASTGPGRHFARYGGRSGQLPATMKLADRLPTARVDSAERNPTLQVWLPSLRVSARGTTIRARLLDDPATPAVISSPLIAIAPDDDTPTTFVAMAAAPTGTASAPEYEKSFVPPAPPATATVAPPRQFRYQVLVRGVRDGQAFERRAGGLFFVHDPRATLDPTATTVTRDAGDLVVRAPLQIDRAGTYFVHAELWGGPDGAGQQAIAFARDRLVGVSPGPRTVELRFGGAIIADSHVDGPYVVRNLRLQQVDTHPAQEGDPVPALPPTPAWPARDFH